MLHLLYLGLVALKACTVHSTTVITHAIHLDAPNRIESKKHLREAKHQTTQLHQQPPHVPQTDIRVSRKRDINYWKWALLIECALICVCCCCCGSGASWLYYWAKRPENRARMERVRNALNSALEDMTKPSETAWLVSGAGGKQFNSLFRQSGTQNGYPAYCTTEGHTLSHRHGRWEMAGPQGIVRYQCDSDSELPPLKGWEVSTDNSIFGPPAPTLIQIDLMALPDPETDPPAQVDTSDTMQSGGQSSEFKETTTWETLFGNVADDVDHLQALSTLLAKSDDNIVKSDGKWITAVSEYMWPRVDKYLQLYANDMVAEQLYKTLPKLKGLLSITDFSFGSAHPKADAIHVRKRGVKEDDLRQNSSCLPSRNRGLKNQVIDVLLHVDTDMNARFSAIGLFTLYLKRIELHGRLFIALRAPLDKPPFYGALEMYFLDPPEIHISTAGSFAAVPGLEDHVREALLNVIKNQCVTPNRSIRMLDAESQFDMADLKRPAPLGILRLTLKSGKSLIASDHYLFSASNSDPFVVMEIGNTEWRSPTVYQSLNPVWKENNIAEFLVFDHLQRINVRVYDENKWKGHNLIGSASHIPIAELVQPGQVTKSQIPLRLRTSVAGSLQVEAHYFSLSPDEPSSNAVTVARGGPSQILIAVKLDEFTDMRRGLAAPFTVQIALGDHCKATSPTSGAKPSTATRKETQDACSKLQASGMSDEQICDLMGLAPEELKVALIKDEAEAKQASWNLDCMRMASHPVFEENLYMLAPWNKGMHGEFLKIKLLDNKQTVVGKGVNLPFDEIVRFAISRADSDMKRSFYFADDICLRGSVQAFFLNTTCDDFPTHLEDIPWKELSRQSANSH